MSANDVNVISQLKIESAQQKIDEPEVYDVMRRYNEVKSKGLNGDFGRTPQYWLNYIIMVSQLQLLQFALKVNNFELKIKCWEMLLPLCFTTNKIHYSRYGTYYLQQMKHLESSHPGATMEIKASCTVRRNNLGIGQAIDLAGEQTYMKSAKTSGNYLFSLIKILASSVEVILFNILNMKIINNKLYLLQVVSHCLLHSPQQSRNGF